MRHMLSILFSILIVYAGYNIGFHNDPTTTVSTQQLSIVTVEARPVEVTPPEPVDPYAGLDVDQVHCLAKNIYFEARGESMQGKIAVASVTMNRVHNARFPDTVCGVVEQAIYSRWWKEHHDRMVPVKWKCQFTWFCDGKSDKINLTDSNGRPIKQNLQAWQQSLEVALLTIRGLIPDNTNGATHYYNPNLASPQWAVHYEEVAQIDNHCFHRM